MRPSDGGDFGGRAVEEGGSPGIWSDLAHSGQEMARPLRLGSTLRTFPQPQTTVINPYSFC